MITADRNRIIVAGPLTIAEMPRLIAAMHNLTSNQGYQDLTLDFTQCEAAFPGPMLGVVVRCQSYWQNGIDIALTLPADPKLRSLFHNTNWAHLIDVQSQPESTFRGYKHVPTIKFSDGEEQHAAVSRILDSFLKILGDFDRSDFRAIEWAINEITDNVINHSGSPVGGFVQVTNFSGAIKRIEFAVADAGLGIPATLRATHPEIDSDSVALDRAIREGVTRDKKIGQGNGLYGTWRITELSGGSLDILSGNGWLSSSQRGLRIQRQPIPFNGALIIGTIKYAQPVDLSDALSFEGKKHVPVDHVEMQYEVGTDGSITFNLAAESAGFGSRSAGEPIRKKLSNLARLASEGYIRVDFGGVPLVSSSFADEVFGKLFVEMGPVLFLQCFRFDNIDPLVRNLIDKAISQRVRDS